MPEKSPENIAWLTYLWVVGTACLGGTVSFIRKVKQGHARAWNITEFIGEVVTAAFAGLITFYLCDWSNFDIRVTVAFAGIAGHMGSRAIFQLEDVFTTKFPSAETNSTEKDR